MAVFLPKKEGPKTTQQKVGVSGSEKRGHFIIYIHLHTYHQCIYGYERANIQYDSQYRSLLKQPLQVYDLPAN